MERRPDGSSLGNFAVRAPMRNMNRDETVFSFERGLYLKIKGENAALSRIISLALVILR